MRNKSKIKTIIIVLGMVFAFLSINNYNVFNDQDGTIEIGDETHLESPKRSGYWTPNFIHIDGSIPNNWSATTGYPWCYVDNGVYIIENVTIDAGSSPTGNGIFIHNSKNEYFIIRNCTVYNAGSGADEAGIKMENTNNGMVVKNNCSNNGYNGIFLYNECDNNTISGNIANDNIQYGIWFQDNCNDNIISGNTANNNITINQNTGITISQSCVNNTISGNTATHNIDYGILLSNRCTNNTVSGNTANNNTQYGIILYHYSNNNTVVGNTANDNEQYGIYLTGSNNNTVSGNTVTNNNLGIALYNSNNNSISGNTANNNGEGIDLNNSNNNNISGNTANNNDIYGIILYDHSNNNTVVGNTANNNTQYGIILYHYSNNNTVVGNTANDNEQYGICLTGSNNNTVSGNTVTNNTQLGIYLDYFCDGNLLFYNWIYNNSIENAIDDGNNQWDNGTIGNYWGDYDGVDANDDGIGDTPYDVPPTGGSVDNCPIWDDGPHVIIINSPNPSDAFGSTAPSFKISINFPIFNTSWYTLDNGLTNYTFKGSSGTINQTAWDECGEGSVSIRFFVNNTAGNLGTAESTVFKDSLTPLIEINSPINNFVFGELAPVYDISIEEENLKKTWYTIDGGINNITFTELTGLINQTLWDALQNGYVTIRFYAIDVVGYLKFEDVIVIKDVPDNLLYVDVIDQSFTATEFIIKFMVQSEIGQEIINAAFQMWWNGTDVSDNVVDLGNGLYFVSLEPITVAPDEDPILLSMIITADGYEDKYFETYIAVEPCEIVKLVQVEIIDHSYSHEHFNFTLFISDEAEQGINLATIQMWWNGNDVSDDVINLGNGLYFVSLEPITVAPGEDPILLKMEIFASGYEDKQFETYLAVDPDTLEKGVEKDGDEFPFMILAIAIVSIAGGIGATIITIGILRKRKPTKEVI